MELFIGIQLVTSVELLQGVRLKPYFLLAVRSPEKALGSISYASRFLLKELAVFSCSSVNIKFDVYCFTTHGDINCTINNNVLQEEGRNINFGGHLKQKLSAVSSPRLKAGAFTAQ